MKPDPDAFIALLSGLPGHHALPGSRQPPLSRLKLERRLATLPDAERALVAEIESLLQWRHFSLDTDNTELVRRQRRLQQRLARQLPELATDDLANRLELGELATLVAERLDLRTLMAALWYRQYGGGQAPAGDWSASRFRQRIEANWQEPGFHLDSVFPWLPEILELMRAQQPWPLEKRLLQLGWQQLERHRQAGDFSIKAVVIYVLKWDMVERWSRHDGDQALRRFRQLCDQGLPVAAQAGGQSVQGVHS